MSIKIATFNRRETRNTPLIDVYMNYRSIDDDVARRSDDVDLNLFRVRRGQWSRAAITARPSPLTRACRIGRGQFFIVDFSI